MRRWIAVLWHASFFVIAGGSVLLLRAAPLVRADRRVARRPRTAMRIVCGRAIGLAALPVVFTLLRTRRPEFGTPQLALSLRVWSIVLHVLAGALIVGAAISEIWVSLDRAGQMAVRHLRRRRGHRDPRRAGLLPGLRRRAAAAAAETAEAPKGRTRGRRGRARDDAEVDEAVEESDRPTTPSTSRRRRGHCGRGRGDAGAQPRSRTPCRPPRHTRRPSRPDRRGRHRRLR